MRNRNKQYIHVFLNGLMLMLICHLTSLGQTKQELRQGFLTPPTSAMPRTWWHWTRGNVSKEGITKDLEWMKRFGIAGFQLADVASGTGQETTEKIDFGSAKWLDAVHYAGKEADRLGLEMAMFSSAGWSLTGGPWVKPEEAMKKLVWSELQIEGGRFFEGNLPHPPTSIGPFGNLKSGGRAGNREAEFYQDVAVIAFHTPKDELTGRQVRPVVTTSSGQINDTLLSNADLNDQVAIRSGADGKAWISYTYSKPFRARSFTIAGPKGIPYGVLSISMDGVHFDPLLTLPAKQGYRGGKIRTFSFPEVTAKYYRLEFTGAPMTPAQVISEEPPTPDSVYLLSQLCLSPKAQIHRWEDKAGFNFLFEYDQVATPTFDSTAYIKINDMVNLSDKVEADGSIRWEAPPGNWTIMRFGYSLTGAKNRPAVPAGLGYEVDKLSKEHTLSYIKTYTGILKKALGDLYGKRLTHIMMDSWEAGIQNWTDKMPAEFKQRRHYDLIDFLPALAGRIVENPTESDRFLWDFRRTLVDLFAENHYQVITDYLHQDGLKTYSEAGGVSLESIEDALLNKKYVDIPMGEFWVKDLHPSSMYEEDVKGAVSAAHVYGKKLVAAESFTGGNYESPYTLKKIADRWMAQGINRLVFHTSAHQPLDTKPGNTMVGTHLHRNITWAELGKPFVTYLSRNAYMLQQGINVADIAYLLPEGAPSTMPFWGNRVQPTPPNGYQYDYINTDALITRMSVNEQGKLVMPDGVRYEVLVLPEIQEMTLPLLQKIYRLVDSGATLVGPKPLHAPSLTAYPSADQEIRRFAAALWGDLDGHSRTINYVGKGKVYWGRPLAEILDRTGVHKDLDYALPLNGQVYWNHRKTDSLDSYFLVNGSDEPQVLDVKFRVSNRYPEIWSPDKGRAWTVPYTTEGGTIRLQLPLEPRESVFVVFGQEKTPAISTLQVEDRLPVTVTWGGPWQIGFPFAAGAKAITSDKLESWTRNSNEDIKYYSGTATYTNTFTIDRKELPKGDRILLDLGKVGDIAEVSLNGQVVDTLWKFPYLTDISKFINSKQNTLIIKVTNQWTNRLAGDRLLPEGQRKLAAFIRPFGGKHELGESGVLGEVSFYIVKSPLAKSN